VSDLNTGLMWQQGDEQNSQSRTWQNALAYCEGLNLAGNNDWRLPNIRELESMVDDSRAYPSCDPVFQCQYHDWYYWSSSTKAYWSDAWFSGFEAGSGGWYDKTSYLYVRCVRGGNVIPSQPTIAQSPPSGPPGQAFVEWGTGFTPNSTATLHFKKPDGTEYPTKDQTIDSIGHFEITYSAPWNKPPGTYVWWAIDGPAQTKSNEVSFVIEGIAGELHHFDITMDGDNLIGNQKVKVPFQIRIQAEDYAHNPVSSFNGKVYLFLVGPGRINPTEVTLINGDKTLDVTIDQPSQATHIHGQSGGAYGDSNDFAVQSTVQVFGSINSYVFNPDYTPLQGATVTLATPDMLVIVSSTISGNGGKFAFSQVPPGKYRIWATYNNHESDKLFIRVNAYELSQPSRLIIHSKKRPVILVAGIMGSTKKWVTAGYPTLPAQEPADRDDLKFWNWGDYAGWDKIKGELKDHYEAYDCPLTGGSAWTDLTIPTRNILSL
jgi:hypothetical protein